MRHEEQDYLEPKSFEGAKIGVRAGLKTYGIEIDDEIATQVAVSALTGFVVKGGLEIDSLERLRDLVLRTLTDHLES
jgi:hypothetical protein